MFKETLELLERRGFLLLWISIVLYLFYSTFTFYLNGRKFNQLRNILGVGLCFSRGTATVLNMCCALVLLPLCKKLNHILYQVLSKLWPTLFFYWLQSAKSFHMTVSITLVLFAVIHSVSHFINLWNFSRNYDDEQPAINFASHKNENPLVLLISPAGLTGVSMLMITLSMATTSLRVVRRKWYNKFWYTHQLYMVFLVMLIAHPLSGVLKEEVIEDNMYPSNFYFNNSMITEYSKKRFIPIPSQMWLWMALPLTCFLVDLLWRICSRNCSQVRILDVSYMAGRTLALTLSSPQRKFVCRPGQYVLLQCLQISLLEWHPFTVVRMPIESSQNNFVVWIRVKGDWTESLERLLLELCPKNLNVLVDGPLSSPIESVRTQRVAMCVAAGVGITPFVALMQNMLENPRSFLPGRIHLLWIVRYEEELTWIANLATKTISMLRDANRPDRLNIEFYVTNNNTHNNDKGEKEKDMLVLMNGKGAVETIAKKFTENEKATLLTPNLKRSDFGDRNNKNIEIDSCDIAKEYPMLACRLRRGRPHWDRVFGYWVHLYQEQHLHLYCCGSKSLVKLLRSKCKSITMTTKTRFTFVHEGFT